MRRPLKLVALTVVLPALLLSGAQVGAAATPMHDRVYLLASDSEYLYWGVDPFDPELGVGTIKRDCGAGVWGIPGRSRPCLAATNTANGYRRYNVFFLPASVLEEKVTWSVASPLNFHIEGSINTYGAPYTVHLVLQKATTLVESEAATPVAPGVWEGKITTGSPLNLTDVNLMAVRIETPAPAATIELDLRGRTYIQLPRPHAARGVPELMREDTYAPEPTTFASPTRSFTFNDADWSMRSFTGRTGPLRSFDFTMDKRAEILLAWVEVYDSAFFQDVRRGRPPDSRKLTQGAALRLMRDGQLIEPSGTGNGLIGLGTQALAVQDLSSGPLTLQVDSFTESEDDSMPFTAYVLEVGGERTIRSMRWRFFQQNSFRLPVAAQCPASYEPVPATDEVRSIALDLDWDTETLGLPAWTFRFDLPNVGLFPCSEAGTGDEVRLTVPAKRIWYVGATPAYDATYVSAFDTTFEVQATYTYTAPGASA